MHRSKLIVQAAEGQVGAIVQSIRCEHDRAAAVADDEAGAVRRQDVAAISERFADRRSAEERSGQLQRTTRSRVVAQRGRDQRAVEVEVAGAAHGQPLLAQHFHAVGRRARLDDLPVQMQPSAGAAVDEQPTVGGDEAIGNAAEIGVQIGLVEMAVAQFIAGEQPCIVAQIEAPARSNQGHDVCSIERGVIQVAQVAVLKIDRVQARPAGCNDGRIRDEDVAHNEIQGCGVQCHQLVCQVRRKGVERLAVRGVVDFHHILVWEGRVAVKTFSDEITGVGCKQVAVQGEGNAPSLGAAACVIGDDLRAGLDDQLIAHQKRRPQMETWRRRRADLCAVSGLEEAKLTGGGKTVMIGAGLDDQCLVCDHDRSCARDCPRPEQRPVDGAIGE